MSRMSQPKAPPAPPGTPTDLPCPRCKTRMTVIPYAPRLTLVYCHACGWNLQGTARELRARNTRYFGASLLLLPLAVPLFAAFHRADPILGYLMDLALIVLLFTPAMIRARRNQKQAFMLDRVQPKRPLSPVTTWSPEPELSAPAPRALHGSGNLTSLSGIMAAIRVLAGVVLSAFMFSLPPVAALMGGATQFVALLALIATLPPFLGLIGFLAVVTRRQRMLVTHGQPVKGEVRRQETVMKRLTLDGEWTLSTRYRYAFEDAKGHSYAGSGREEGRAIAEGDALTVLTLPEAPSTHVAYGAALYRAGEPPVG